MSTYVVIGLDRFKLDPVTVETNRIVEGPIYQNGGNVIGRIDRTFTLGDVPEQPELRTISKEQLRYLLLDYAQSHGKIQTIKFLRLLTGMSLRDSKELVEDVCEVRGNWIFQKPVRSAE